MSASLRRKAPEKIQNIFGDEFPADLSYEQAVAFLQRRGWLHIQGVEKNPRCGAHQKSHPIGFEMMGMGIYHGFDTEQEVIDWVKRLIPNSI